MEDFDQKELNVFYEKWLTQVGERLFDDTPFGYLLMLPNQKIFQINQTLLQWLGLEKNQVINQKTFQKLLTIGGQIYYETHHCNLENLQGFVKEVNYNLLGKNRKRIPVLVTTKQIKNEVNELMFTEIYLFHFSERKKYERELLLSKKAAEAANAAKAEFISTISHEIRTPIHAIMGVADLLSKDNPNDSQKKLLSTLRFSTKNLLQIINGVLDFSKLEIGKMQLDQSSVNLRQFVNELVKSLRTRIKTQDVQLLTEIDEAIPEYLLVDWIKISQILNNLISNAIKFTLHGEIIVTLKLIQQKGNNYTIEVSVKDTGIGILAKYQDHIFEIFQQGDSIISNEYGGTGLGLAISKRLVELHGSELELESVENEGSNFYFTLNLEKVDKPKSINNKEVHHSSKVDLSNIRVLLAEDNETNLFIVSSYFNRWKLNFDHAPNGLKAVEMVQEKEYDLVLMDIRMPLVDGYEATRQIRNLPAEKFKNLPIIALSASATHELKDQLTLAGMDGHLLKPFDSKELQRIIQSYQPLETLPNDSLEGEKEKLQLETKNFTLTSLNEFFENDKEAIFDFLAVVLTDWRNSKEELIHAVQLGDSRQFADVIHSLHSSIHLLEMTQWLDVLNQGKEHLASGHYPPNHVFWKTFFKRLEEILGEIESVIEI